jgi:hypothetical protein
VGRTGEVVYSQMVNRIKTFPGEQRERTVNELVTTLGGDSTPFNGFTVNAAVVPQKRQRGQITSQD